MIKNILVLSLVIAFNSCTNTAGRPQQTSLSAIDFSQKIAAAEQPQLIDVRTPEEFKNGHLKDAVNIDWNGNEFGVRVAGLDKAKPVFIYCLSGGRSSSAAVAMRKAGFKEVVEMSGGLIEWRANNLPETAIAGAQNGMSTEQYQALLQSDKLVLIDFYAEWCAPCKKMKPYLDKISAENTDKVNVVRINADDNAGLCKELKINSLPVLKLYRNRLLVWEKTGFAEEREVRKQLDNK